MKREIKFRAWDTVNNKYFKPNYEAHKGILEDLNISLNGRLGRRTLLMPAEDESLFEGQYEIEQFTGLKDKKGKETYENDIFKRNDHYGKVISSPSGIWLIAFDDGKIVNLRYDHEWNWDINDENIIGNIHENPELL